MKSALNNSKQFFEWCKENVVFLYPRISASKNCENDFRRISWEWFSIISCKTAVPLQASVVFDATSFNKWDQSSSNSSESESRIDMNGTEIQKIVQNYRNNLQLQALFLDLSSLLQNPLRVSSISIILKNRTKKSFLVNDCYFKVVQCIKHVYFLIFSFDMMNKGTSISMTK